MSDDKILAVYDITGIQNFIFATNRLRENLGGSIIVKKASEDLLKDTIKDKCKNTLEKIESKDIRWNDHEAVIVYLGGGNALVIFNELEKAIEITKALSEEILELSGGLLSFNVAYEKINLNNFRGDYNNVFANLIVKKNSFVKTTPLLGIGITKAELSSGLPVQYVDIKSREYLSFATKSKREKNDSKHFDYLLTEVKNYVFPLQFEDLGQKVGDNYISVVHIDGDSIGKTIHEFLNEPIDDYGFSLYRMSKFSRELNEIYTCALKLVIKDLAKSLESNEFKENFKLKLVNSAINYLPIRPIILKGDDITFITNGKLGVNLAAMYLKKLSELELNVLGKQIPLSASAGVAIVKTTFPFDRAYTLAEELCKSAKKKGKIIQVKNNLSNRGFWLDFHIIQSGFTSDLNETRKTQYTLQGVPDPDDLTAKDNKLIYKQNKLLWRPWCVVGDPKLPSKYSWKNLTSLIQGFLSSEDKWPRSKVKKLQHLLTGSNEEVNHFILRMGSRGVKLPPFQNEFKRFYDNVTPYFDALELLDYYLPQMEEILE